MILQRLLSLAALVSVLASCGETINEPDGETVASVRVSPVLDTIEVGETAFLTASVFDAQGGQLNALNYIVTWSSNDPARATVTQGFTSSEATVSGIQEGVAVITAASNGRSGTATIVVEAPAVPGSIEATVTDPFGSEIDGIGIVLERGGQVVLTESNAPGSFVISNVSPGSYTLRVTRSGFLDGSATVVVQNGQTSTVALVLEPEGQPSIGALSMAAVSAPGGTTIDFEVEVVVFNSDGSANTSLGQTAFDVAPFTSGGTSFTFQRQSVQTVGASGQGPYSALLHLDQSGSILGTDPNDSRIQAAKIFFGALGFGDEAFLCAFASSNSVIDTNRQWDCWGSTFTSAPDYGARLDQLARTEGGGTPLFRTTLSVVNVAATEANNANKAVILFTDGDDTAGGATVDDVVAAAVAQGVRIFTVGLGTGTDIGVLIELARRTGGAVMRATDARQLVSWYGSLGAILRGDVSTYRTRFRASRSQGQFLSGGWFQTFLVANTGAGSVAVPIRIPY